MLAKMDKFFLCFLLLLWIPPITVAKKLKRIEDRITRIESKHDIDSMTRREDISDLSQRLDDVEKWLNSSLTDLSVSVRPSEIAGGGADPGAMVSELDGSLMDDIERVKSAFADEKARWRRQAADMEHSIQTHQDKTSSEIQSLLKTQATDMEHSIQTHQDKMSSEIQSLVKTVKNDLASEVSKMMTEINHELLSEIQSLVKTAKNELASEVSIIMKGDKEELSEIQSSIKEVKVDVENAMDTLDTLQSIKQDTSTNCLASPVILEKLGSIDQMLVGHTSAYPSCLELYKSGKRVSGVYNIVLAVNSAPIRVYCDMTTDGGGWTVFQRRQDGSEDFFRGWDDYASGFGNVNSEFWLGNDYISQITGDCCHELRIDMEDFEGNTAYAKYGRFKVFPRGDDYKLDVGVYSGNASDSLEYHSGMSFTTKDKDNDQRSSSNCAQDYTGAWWYGNCHYSNLNGAYLDGESSYKGINWQHWKSNKSLKRTEMKFRKL